MCRPPGRARASLTAFRRDEGGAVLIYVTLLMLAIIGLLALAIDAARVMYLNSNLQEIADAAALAGAKQLDGRTDAITRATKAATSVDSDHVYDQYLRDNKPDRWSDDGSKAATQIVTSGADGPVFYSSLNPDVVTTDPSKASYIKVTTISRRVNLTFARTITDSDQAGTKATAIARSAFSACAGVQSFLCNPWESDQSVKGGADNWSGKVAEGQMFVLAGGSDGSPGNWGLIDPPGGKGHNPHDLAPFWSEQDPYSCPYITPAEATNYVDPGNNSPKAREGMNVRFDNPGQDLNNTAAPIVIDGLTPNGLGGYGCKSDQSATPTDPKGKVPPFQQTNIDATAYTTYCTQSKPLGSCPLPRDRDLGVLNQVSSTMRGTGPTGADLDAYWANHHVGTRPVSLNTRWKIYQCEADATKCPQGTSGAFTQASSKIESPTPECKQSTVGTASRRLIRVAIVDCNYWGVTGASQPLPISTTVAEFFMTEPATEDTKNTALQGRMYAELVRTYSINSEGSALYHVVQLVK